MTSSASQSRSKVLRRSVHLSGRKTSVCLEEPFWAAIRQYAGLNGQSVSAYIEELSQHRRSNNLSSELRMHVLRRMQADVAAWRERAMSGSEGEQEAQRRIAAQQAVASQNVVEVQAKAALQRACDIAGGQLRLAELIQASQPAVCYWLTKSKKGAGPRFVKRIEAVTGVPSYELRPDIYPHPGRS